MERKDFFLLVLVFAAFWIIIEVFSNKTFRENSILAGEKVVKEDVITCEVVRSRAIYLVDKNDKIIARIGANDTGEPSLTLLDNGKKRATFQLINGNPLLSFFDAEEKAQIGLALLGDDVVVNFKSNKASIGMTIIEDNPMFMMSGADPMFTVVGKGAATLDFLSGGPALSLRDDQGKVRSILGRSGVVKTSTGEETKLAESSLSLFDKEGKCIWKAP